MHYVRHNPAGRIIGLSEDPGTGSGERLSLDAPQVQAFLEMAGTQLSFSDIDTIRVIEDLVDVRSQKKLLLLTDLPLPAQRRIMQRQRIRSELGVLENLIVAAEDIW